MQIDVIVSLLSGRLVRERIGPAMLSAVQSQVLLFCSKGFYQWDRILAAMFIYFIVFFWHFFLSDGCCWNKLWWGSKHLWHWWFQRVIRRFGFEDPKNQNHCWQYWGIRGESFLFSLSPGWFFCTFYCHYLLLLVLTPDMNMNKVLFCNLILIDIDIFWLLVCFQDFQLGETVRSLPHCHHMFHLPCIDMWLLRHGSCPLCRRDL